MDVDSSLVCEDAPMDIDAAPSAKRRQCTVTGEVLMRLPARRLDLRAIQGLLGREWGMGKVLSMRLDVHEASTPSPPPKREDEEPAEQAEEHGSSREMNPHGTQQHVHTHTIIHAPPPHHVWSGARYHNNNLVDSKNPGAKFFGAGGGGGGGGGSGSSDPSKEGPPGCNLFVYHTPPSWGDNEIAAAFAPYGKIVSATIMKNKATGLSKGFGFVSFDNTTSANNAIAGMAGFEVEGKRLKVEIKKAKGEANFGMLGAGGGGSPEKQHGPAGCNLFIYHCPAAWDDEAIKQAFSPYGAIVSATIMKDKSTGASKGFGFVSFDNPIAAQQAIQGMNGHEVEGKRLKVELKQAKGPPAGQLAQLALMGNMGWMGMMAQMGGLAALQQGGGGGGNKGGPAGCNLFIYHVPPTWGDDDIRLCFAPFGTVISATIMKDRSTGASKGYGFVSYDNPVSAQTAVQAMNGMQVDGKRLKVELKTAKGQGPY
eukprot:Tamp_08849.p1 GENE.Tamp_08849~~Tamp_08849.p1  ORF type:complete len:500 (+),score=120.90 Tamp_08849:57-1502(+)